MKQLSIFTIILVIGLGLFVTGCGNVDWPNSPNPGPSESPSPAPSLPPEIENPLVTGPQMFAQNGNLWKPVSDTSGNMVVVLDPKFKKLFTYGCKAQLKSGKWHDLFCGGVYKCFGNSYNGVERMHMRSNYKCSQFKEVRVECEEEKQTVVFTVAKANLKKVCERFG